ncbi:MAG: C39 family peptidase [Pseudomonadota bacterium]|nr:C39 family peptidase [Pseudomonadota bacterium]
MLPVAKRLPVTILPQPDEITCGPTCLHAIYRYWGDNEPLSTVIGRAHRFEAGGTVAVFLACDALRKGYAATIYTYNLMVFDPTWFGRPRVDIAERLALQREHKRDERLSLVTEGYIEFLKLGGRLRLFDLSRHFIRSLLRHELPILTGLSSTHLYRTRREYGPDDTPDDVRGYPTGHFIVLAGYDWDHRRVLVADPYGPNPFSRTQQYWINVDRVVNAVLLGIVTHDANLLVIAPPRPRGPA